MRICTYRDGSVSARAHLRTRTWHICVCTRRDENCTRCYWYSSLNSIRLDSTLARINAMPENYRVNPKPRKSKARRTRTACIANAQNRFSLCAYLIYTLVRENALTAANRELSASARYADDDNRTSVERPALLCAQPTVCRVALGRIALESGTMNPYTSTQTTRSAIVMNFYLRTRCIEQWYFTESVKNPP